jgi:DNA polymerase-4
MLADLDCFFVAVERLHRPELHGRAVVVGGRPGSRGVVAACSYEARALGIHSAMPMGEAYRRAGIPLPHTDGGPPHQHGHPPHQDDCIIPPTGVVFLHDGLFGNYTRYSQRVQDILRESVPIFRTRSIDEFELDVSGCERLFERDYGGIVPFAEHLRRRVREEVGLPLSIGIGPSRLIAKMASRHAKPDGVFRVLPEEVAEFLRPHDVQDVPGIGPVTAATLRDLGINRVEQLLRQPPSVLRRMFGIGMVGLVEALKAGEDTAPGATEEAGASRPADRAQAMWDDSAAGEAVGLPLGAARGRMNPAISFGVAHGRSPKSIGHETTFDRDEIDPAVWERTLWRLTEDACQRLRAADLRARHVTVKIRYSDFATLTHGGPLPEPTDADSAVFQRVMELFHEGNTRRLRIRLLGVRLERLSAGASQGLLFESRRERRAHDFFAAVDSIRARWGKETVLVGPGVSRLKEKRPLEAMSTAGVQTGFTHGR